MKLCYEISNAISEPVVPSSTDVENSDSEEELSEHSDASDDENEHPVKKRKADSREKLVFIYLYTWYHRDVFYHLYTIIHNILITIIIHKILLFYICNPTVFQSAAALCIGVGSFSDPHEIPGLAHFLEHSKYYNICSETIVFIINNMCFYISFQWCLWEVKNTLMRMVLILSLRNMVALTMHLQNVSEYVPYCVILLLLVILIA